MYQVLARKWRPRTFDELVGQDHVARTLANAIENDRLAHAYVFSGVRGTGKTSAARILAKCLNCEQGPTAAPCNECAPCVEIAEARAMDVLEMDAASRTGVDDIRELQEVVQYPPVRDRTKLLIIDEAHMLSKQAFNALLKTLEEPPPQVVFVLATTELQKVLPTILSRCQVFEFRRVVPADVADHLERLAKAESLDISRASLERIARAGEGSVRDSLSLLERVLAFCGNQAADEDVLRVLGAVRFDLLEATVRGMAGRDAALLLETLDTLCSEGHDLNFYWSELIGALRDLLLHAAAPRAAEATATRSPQEFERLAAAAEGLEREDLLRILQILAELEPALKASARPRFLFEAALVRIAELAKLRPIEDLLDRLESGAVASPSTPSGGSPAARPRSGKGNPPRSEKKKAAHGSAGRPVPSDRFQAEFLDAVERIRPMIAAWLSQAATIRPEHGVLQIELPEDQALARDQLLRESTVKVLAEQAAELLGGDGNWKVAIACRGDAATPAGAGSPKRPTVRAESSADSARPAAPTGADRLRLGDEVKGDPAVSKLLKTFGAQVVDLKPHTETALEPPAPEEES